MGIVIRQPSSVIIAGPSGRQMGGVSPGLIEEIGKAGYGITKALGQHQQKRALKISAKRRRAVDESYARGKPKRYAGESFNCSIM